MSHGTHFSCEFSPNQLNTRLPRAPGAARAAGTLLQAALLAAALGGLGHGPARAETAPPAARQGQPAEKRQPPEKRQAQRKEKRQADKKPPAKPRAAPRVLVGTGPSYGERPEALAFAQELADTHRLPLAWTRQALAQARQSPAVRQLILPPALPSLKNWRAYRSRFLDEPRIQAGLAFWRAHAAELARAETVYGVPAEIVVGILGVETIYGREMGRFRVLDALSTLAFDFPPEHPRAAERSAFFRKELGQFLLQQHRSRSQPATALGSYAGAAGMPQFMPSSRTHFAVDFDRDGRIDLSASTSDVIGSVAHYLQAFQWQRGMPTHYPVSLDQATLDLDALLAPDILPTFGVASFTAKGAVLQGAALDHTGPLALVELRNGTQAPSYVAGTENFYAITRYNWSSYYAMAVIELGQEIARRKQMPAP